jgi:hypothetical protein
MASSELSISHQIKYRRGRVDVRANWRGAWWWRVSQGEMCCCRLGSVGGCGRNEWNAAITKMAGMVWWCGRGSNAELANNDEGGQDVRVYVMAASVRLVWW